MLKAPQKQAVPYTLVDLRQHSSAGNRQRDQQGDGDENQERDPSNSYAKRETSIVRTGGEEYENHLIKEIKLTEQYLLTNNINITENQSHFKQVHSSSKTKHKNSVTEYMSGQ